MLEIHRDDQLFQTLYPTVDRDGNWGVRTTKAVTTGSYTATATEMIGDVNQSTATVTFPVT